MKIAIMQPYFFPYIGYFQLINCVDKFIIYDDVNYIKKGWINRNRILINEEEYMFTIPLKKASQNKLISDIEVSLELSWRLKLLKTIENNFKRSPFFEETFHLFAECILDEETNLSKYVLNSLKRILSFVNIKTEIIDSSSRYSTKSLKGKEKILEICRQENTDEYINPIGGTELYNKDEFTEKNIDLRFLKTNNIEYERMNQSFLSSLSILDVMMFNSKEKIMDLLESYELE
jgi:hypothetical protein